MNDNIIFYYIFSKISVFYCKIGRLPIEDNNVSLIGGLKVLEFTEKGVIVLDNNKNTQTIEADTIITSFGMKAKNSVFWLTMAII